MTIWTIGDVLEYVEHPTRMVRTNSEHPELSPFKMVNALGAILNRFSPEDQEFYISNLVDTLDQVENS